MNKINITYYDSPIGFIEMSATENGLCGLYFVNEKSTLINNTKILKKGIKQLDEYFKGKRNKFNLPIDMQGTDFQKKIWMQLLKIPFGVTKSYLDIAKALGNYNLLRAVGNANSKNKISIIIPCHRVIGSDGSLTGFAGGLWRKQWLINHEAKFIQGILF